MVAPGVFGLAVVALEGSYGLLDHSLGQVPCKEDDTRVECIVLHLLDALEGVRCPDRHVEGRVRLAIDELIGEVVLPTIEVADGLLFGILNHHRVEVGVHLLGLHLLRQLVEVGLNLGNTLHRPVPRDIGFIGGAFFASLLPAFVNICLNTLLNGSVELVYCGLVVDLPGLCVSCLLQREQIDLEVRIGIFRLAFFFKHTLFLLQISFIHI